TKNYPWRHVQLLNCHLCVLSVCILSAIYSGWVGFRKRRTGWFRKRDTRDTIPGLLGDTPVFDPSTTPTNLPTQIFALSYYSLRRKFTCNRKVM
uniref:Uncharacterized protein n=1 Tax=Sander lucioperca TaxID=283035 RepID=A0A8C9WVW2_SANLU